MKQVIKVIAMLTVIFSGQTIIASANEGPKYTVTPILPNNQVVDVKDQFDLQVSPNEKKTIEVLVTNNSDEKIHIKATAVTGITNSNGIIDYTADKVAADETFKDIATVKEKQVIPPQSNEKIQITYTVPKNGINGLMLGGIKVEEEAMKTSKQTIKNKYNYVIPIKLHTEKKLPQATVNFKDIAITQNGLRNTITTTLENPQGAILRNITMSIDIKQKNSNKTYYSKEIAQLKFAPNTTFDYQWPINKEFEAGSYEATLHIKADGFEKEWNKSFEMEAKKVKDLNKSTVSPTDNNADLQMYILMGIIAVLILLIILILIKVRRRKADEK